MNAAMSASLEEIVANVVSLNAQEIDESGTFPREAIDAFGKAGFLSLTTATEFGGGGAGLAEASHVIERIASSCGSTAMIVLMHYAANAIIEAHGSDALRREIGAGGHLSTLAFSEFGSRSHFWSPVSTATEKGEDIVLDAKKSWVTSANEADSYVWSSRPVAASGPMTLWSVPSSTKGLERSTNFNGLGLRGNGSVPVSAVGATISKSAMLGADGAGLDIALATALPWFLVMSASFGLGLMESVTAETLLHLQNTRLEHLDQALIDQPLPRLDFARMRLTTDTLRAFLADTLAALSTSRPDAMLRVLESKALSAESSVLVTDLAMKVCGGSAFRKELGVERHFRDARAARVMAPTTDALLDFIGRAVSGLQLLDA